MNLKFCQFCGQILIIFAIFSIVKVKTENGTETESEKERKSNNNKDLLSPEQLIENLTILLYKKVKDNSQLDKNVLDKSKQEEREQYLHKWMRNGHRNGTLWNWIQFYEENLEKSAEKLLKSLDWRRQNGIDMLKTYNPPNDLKEEVVYYLTGFGKDGQLFIYIPLKSWDIRGQIIKGHRVDIVKYLLKLVEDILNFNDAQVLQHTNSSQNGEIVEIYKANIVVDLEGFTLYQVSSVRVLSLLAQLLKLWEEHYPFLISKMVGINAANYQLVIINVMKNVLSSKSFDLITLYGKEKSEWEKDVLGMAPHELIPTNLGGSYKIY